MLPAIVNPESGYVQACGSPPWAATDSSGLRPDAWPPGFPGARDTSRPQRPRRLLGMGQRSFHEAQSMLYDVLVPFAVEAVPRLLDTAALQRNFMLEADPDLPGALDLLRNWNCVADTDSPGMTFFHVWWSSLKAIMPGIRTDGDLYAALATAGPEIGTMALRAASDAARAMRNDYHGVVVPWGHVHTVRRGGQEYPMPGAMTGEPLFVASDGSFVDGKWPATYGYGFAMAVKFGQTPEAVSVTPFGASERPDSPHFSDQLDLMLERRFKVTHFQYDEVQRFAERAYGTRIGLRPPGMTALFTIHGAGLLQASLPVSSDPPAPLPAGLATFTVYAAPEVIPVQRPAEIEMEIHIPPEVCAQEHLSMLALYAFDAEAGWTRVARQWLDPQNRTLAARDGRRDAFAVLGPEEFRISTSVVVDSEPLHVAKADAGEQPAAQKAKPGFAAPLAPLPAPGAQLEVQKPGSGEPQIAGNLLLPEDTPVYTFGPDKEALKDRKAPRSSPESPASSPLEPAERAEADSVEVPPAGSSVGAQPVPDVPPPGPAETAREEDAAYGITAPPPPTASRLSAPRPSGPGPLGALLPEPRAFGETRWGQMLELRPPDAQGLFHISAGKTLRARLVTSPEAPAPLPTGLAPLTRFVAVECWPPAVKPEVALRLIAPGESRGEAALYAYDQEAGWQRVGNQKHDAATDTFSALDQGARIYAVLAPSG